MKFSLEATALQATRHVGPACIACGNTRRFVVTCQDGHRVAELNELPQGDYHVLACGRCGARHSVVITNID